MNIIDPRKIEEKDMPQVVCADNQQSVIGWGIKAHSKLKLVRHRIPHKKDCYSHIMVMHRPGFFASQGWMYKEVPIEAYLKGNYRLKFWKCKDLTNEEREAWLALTQKELDAPWWERKYDIFGIAGQFLFLRFLNNPWTRYCSERVAPKIRKFFKAYLKKHPSPTESNLVLKISPRAEVYGYCLPE